MTQINKQTKDYQTILQMKKEIIATMKGETFVDKSDDLLFYIQKVFFMMINIRKLEKRSKEILKRVCGFNVADESDDDSIYYTGSDVIEPTGSDAILSTGSDFISDVLSATTSHPRCKRFPVASRYRIEFLRFFQSLVQNRGEEGLQDADVKIKKALEDEGHYQRVGVGGWELFDVTGSHTAPSLNPPTGVQAEDAYKTHILLNGKHPITIFECADAVDEVFATTGLSTWTASFVLNDWITLNTDLFRDKRILELGCGIGLTGLITVFDCQPQSYVFTDYHEKVISRCQEHIDLNLKYASDKIATKTETRLLNWAEYDPNIEKFAWMTESFDIVIGSDIIYHPSIIPPLVNVLKHVLRPKRSKNEEKKPAEEREEEEGQMEEEEEGKGKEGISKPIAYISAAVRKPMTFDYFVLCLKNSSMEVEEVSDEELWDCGNRDFFNFSDSDASFKILKITDDSCEEEFDLLRGN